MRKTRNWTLAAALGPTMALGAPALAADLRVPDDYSTIQEAIDAAANDDVIVVEAGTYDESLVVGSTPWRVTLLAEGEVVVRGVDDQPALRCDDAFMFMVEGVTFESGGHGVVAENGTDSLWLQLCTIRDCGGDGFHADGSSWMWEVMQCRIENVEGHGVFATDGSNGNVGYSYVGSTGGSGIHLEVPYTQVLYNVVENAGDDGIHIEGSDEAYVWDNLIATPGGDAIDTSNIAELELDGNYIDDGSGAVPAAKSTRAVAIVPDRMAIRLASCSKTRVIRTNVGRFAGHGIHATGCELEVTLSDIVGTTGSGIVLVDAVPGSSIEGNSVDRSEGTGLHVRGGTVSVEGNILRSVGGDAVLLSGDGHVAADNVVISCGGDGIRVEDLTGAAPVSIDGNLVERAGGDGIDLGDANGVDVKSNFVTGSRANGVRIGRGTNVTLSDNIASGSRRFDFSAGKGGENVVVSGNRFRRSNPLGKRLLRNR